MLLSDRICKDEVISDYEAEVKKIREVKLFSSRTPGLLQQTESFLMVRLPAQRPFYRGTSVCKSTSKCPADAFKIFPEQFQLYIVMR